MSAFSTIAAAVGAASVVFSRKRGFGGILPGVTISESQTDSLVVTKHPVQQGASITDHAYKEPATVTLEVAWTDASLFLDSVISGNIFAGNYSNVRELYGEILALQEARELIDLTTGLRDYEGMLITEISNTTNRETENALHLTIKFVQVIITETETVTLAASESHAAPEATGSLKTEGTKQIKEAPPAQQSILKKIFG